jgi:hypothetical protein
MKLTDHSWAVGKEAVGKEAVGSWQGGKLKS